MTRLFLYHKVRVRVRVRVIVPCDTPLPVPQGAYVGIYNPSGKLYIQSAAKGLGLDHIWYAATTQDADKGYVQPYLSKQVHPYPTLKPNSL